MAARKKFTPVTISAASNKVYGLAGYFTDNETGFDGMPHCSVHTVEITSSGAAVATITFNMGSGYGSAQTLTLGAAGTISQPYYMPGCVAIKIAIATTACTVIVDSREV